MRGSKEETGKHTKCKAGGCWEQGMDGAGMPHEVKDCAAIAGHTPPRITPAAAVVASFLGTLAYSTGSPSILVRRCNNPTSVSIVTGGSRGTPYTTPRACRDGE